MTQHTLLNRTEQEVTWFQRRSFLSHAAAFVGAGGFSAAFAQGRSNIVDFTGDALLNGEPLRREMTIQSGDNIQTGPNSNLVFVIGNSSFQVRQNSRLAVDRGMSINAVAVLRLLTGAVVSVWGKGTNRRITTPTLTAGIRGTGVYTEVFPGQDFRTYFCNCYGVVEMAGGPDRALSKADYHQSFWGEAVPKNGQLLRPSNPLNHTDEELEALAKLVDQRTNWQIAGRKGPKDGLGYLEGAPTAPHPAANLAR